MEAEGIGLQRHKIATGTQKFEFVTLANGGAGHEDFPHADVEALSHHVAAAVPVVEIADHRHAPGIGGPHGEMYAVCTFMIHGMGAKPVMEAQMIAFGNVIIIERPQHRPKQIGIDQCP